MAVGSIQDLGGGRWRVRVYAGRDPITSRKRYVDRTIRGTRRDADKAAARLLTDVDAGDVGPATVTVGQLLDRWLAHAAPDLAPYTLRGYRSKADQYLRPALGDLQLRKLTPARLDDLYVALRTRGGTDSQGLSPQSVRHVHAIIRRACHQAIRWGWLTRNPAELASPPSVGRHDSEPPAPADLARALHAARDHDLDLFDLARIAIVTGARRGELCGLRWSDVDVDSGDLTIARSIVEPTRGELVVKPPKTGKARTLALPIEVLEILRARRVRLAEVALACGIQLAGDAYIFAEVPDGLTPLRPDLVTSRWRRLATRAGIPGCRFHDLRHFAVTYMLGHGIDAGTAGRRVGHASTRMTLDTYGHAVRAADQRAAELLGGVLELGQG